MLASMGIVARSFEEPDELVTSPLVEVQVVVLGEVYVARTVHQPGWSWSEHMRPVVGTVTCQHHHQGFVRVAFRLAFWELLHRPTFRDAVLDAANRGGDADTNAAIVGALVGSRVGVDGIPKSWRDTVLDCTPNGPTVWSTTYHPKIFGCSPPA